MRRIAIALGVRPGTAFTVRTIAMFALATSAITLVQVAAWHRLEQWRLLTHAISWAAWFVWQGSIFPRARGRYLRRAPESAYARAFYFQIWPGVSFGVSQMAVPVAIALADGFEPHAATAGFGLIIAAGGALMASAFWTIGFDRAGFLSEYAQLPELMCRGSIYAFMRHPLFVGGALLSVGGTLFFGADTVGLLAAFFNVLALPVYGRIEDARLIGIFGDEYRRYAGDVGGLLPRRDAAALMVRMAVQRAVPGAVTESPQ